MRIINCFLLIVFFSTRISAQTTDTTSLVFKKRIVDSIVNFIDNNKDLGHGWAEGNTKGEEGFDFNIIFYYKPSHEIIKLSYNFPTKRGNYYYINHQLQLIEENESQYYLINGKIVNKDGIVIDFSKSKGLIEFEATIKELLAEELKGTNFKLP